jgi:hypothetical protein
VMSVSPQQLPHAPQHERPISAARTHEMTALWSRHRNWRLIRSLRLSFAHPGDGEIRLLGRTLHHRILSAAVRELTRYAKRIQLRPQILSGLNEGQVVEYEEVAKRGKTSAENLKVSRDRAESSR